MAAGIGVAGSGISGCGPAIGLGCNITQRASVRAMLDEVALAYGGFDAIEITAGVFWPSDTTGHIPDEKWAFIFDVNVTGSYLSPTKPRRRGRNKGCRGVWS
jgi:NAD(P)-dependent dehydrogenase (short-subunit alcohol dehydrogenase family)